jgi:hypothetical protein
MSSDAPKNGEYQIGRGRPPTHSRFKPGQSGNPSGRPRATTNAGTLLLQVLDESVQATEGSKTRKITKREVIVKRLVNKAMQGDTASIKILLASDPSLLTSQAATNSGAPDLGRSMADPSKRAQLVQIANGILSINESYEKEGVATSATKEVGDQEH